jgi:predicted small lipoprotein YifL
MKFRSIILLILFFLVFSFNGCGRKDAPLKPSQIISKQ